ncbi:hypothetical protein [Actinokineospora sp. UTMC 2448]|uniref:hypothetical protein n=1 Tax=Actinokineospora sp. UTMC 2448 TaxID=2268449 RepID=UPI0021648AFD|nr:hypothetical protein [Actinokineospora sp. UTMC 2448]UVS77338.1 hypothetical protein Actkin_01047 [Actinokineospora sp. UTMC 2448]
MDMTLLTHAIDAEGDAAAQNGTPLEVHLTAVLLAFGANPSLLDPMGRSPIEVAEDYHHDLAIKLLGMHLDRQHNNT